MNIKFLIITLYKIVVYNKLIFRQLKFLNTNMMIVLLNIKWIIIKNEIYECVKLFGLNS